MPLSGLCAMWRCRLACCGRHGERRCAPGAGEKPVAFLPRSSFVVSKRKLQKLCVGRWGPVTLWMCVLSSALICNALAWGCSRRRDKREVSIGHNNVLLNLLCLCVLFITYNSHHKSRAHGGRITPAPQAPTCGQKTKCCIEGENPAAAGIRRFFSLGRRVENMFHPEEVCVQQHTSMTAAAT